MFDKKKRQQEKKLDKKLFKNLDTAANKAVKEAKHAQSVIIANGFTLELFTAFGGKAKHD